MKLFLPAFSVALACWLLGPTHSTEAQTPAMNLMGSVQSDERQPLPGAAITVIHLPSGVRHAAASDGTGRFVIANLMVGGPYTIRVGEGGYRPLTVENIFLETGKAANFTVTLDKLISGAGRNRSSRATAQNSSILAFAPESAVGGPVLMSMTAQPMASKPFVLAAPVATTPSQAPALASHAPASAPSQAAVPMAGSRSKTSSRYPARRPDIRVDDPIVPGHYDDASGNYIYNTGLPTTLKLAGGGTIAAVGANSTESHLYRFLTDPKMQVDTVDLTRGWYNFDKVFFETGKATLTTESVSQLRNIATILRAYPNTRIKLGGYTDNTGDYKINKQLSEARAQTAWKSLVEMGVGPGRIDFRGYGSNYSIAANDTEEGRAQNRRLSLKVLHK